MVRKTWLVDGVLAAGVAALVTVMALRAEEPGARSPAVAAFVLGGVVGGLLLVRRRWPVPVLVALATAVMVYPAYGFPGIGFLWPLLVGIYTAAAAGRPRAAVAVPAGVLAVQVTWLLAAAEPPLLSLLTSAVTEAVTAGLAVALGDAVWSRRGWSAEARDRLREMAEAKEREARQRVVDERLRIARELHDVSAHTLTVVAVQVNLARDALAATPAAVGEARAALDTAGQVSDQAVRELGAAVRVLRDSGEPAGRSPLPGLADLDRLVAAARAAGLRVELATTGDRPQVPPAAALTAYRVVQEALTNVVRHAGATSCRVEVTQEPGMVRVEVSDDGTGAGAGADAGAGAGAGAGADVAEGHGLAGLRERVTGLGGRFRAGPDARGYLVSASIPTGTGAAT